MNDPVAQEEQNILSSLKEERIKKLEKTFAHKHVAKYENGELTDECAKCGLDIRDNIHIKN